VRNGRRRVLHQPPPPVGTSEAWARRPSQEDHLPFDAAAHDRRALSLSSESSWFAFGATGFATSSEPGCPPKLIVRVVLYASRPPAYSSPEIGLTR
jgi:hypothetical protein